MDIPEKEPIAAALPSDDVITEEEIEAADGVSEYLFDALLDEFDAHDEDPAAVAYGIWRRLTQHLTEYGWTCDDLGKEAARHAAEQESDGHA